MSSILHSDAAPTPSSDAGLAQHMRSSSARPRAPPSSAGAHSDGEGYPEDGINGADFPRRRANGPRTDIQKVPDVVGDTLAERFEEFLER